MTCPWRRFPVFKTLRVVRILSLTPALGLILLLYFISDPVFRTNILCSFLTRKERSIGEHLRKVVYDPGLACSVTFQVVLFTSFKDDESRTLINEQVLQNWGQYYPTVQPVAFLSNSSLTDPIFLQLLTKNHWHYYPNQEENFAGTPKLKPMFKSVSENKKYEKFFLKGFVNGDIMFSEDFIKTLLRIQCIFHFFHIKDNFLITGMRWNYDFFSHPTREKLWDTNSVLALKSKSNIFEVYAEDYFIVGKHFPWEEIEDVVIGRPGYDNYLVYMAKLLGILTIDVTNTASAVHLSASPTVMEGFTYGDSMYNRKLLGNVPYKCGYTSRTCLKTAYSDGSEASVQLFARTSEKCNLEKFNLTSSAYFPATARERT